MTIEFDNMDQVVAAVEMSRECLSRYSSKKPREFLQLDHHGGDDGDWSLDTTYELMQGMPVRVLINGDVSDTKRLVKMLRDIAKWIEADNTIEARIKGLNQLIKHKYIFDTGEIPF